MPASDWSSTDLRQMEVLGIAPEEADRQLSLFRDPPSLTVLDRPATAGDGILRLDEAQVKAALEMFEAARKAGRFMKFVPASGAASRMFQLLAKFSRRKTLTRKSLEGEAAKGDKEAGQLLLLMGSLRHLAFVEDLREALARKGKDLAVLLSEGDLAGILAGILEGLGYSDKPKGLVPFHVSPTGPRTPIQEHLVEAVHTVQDAAKRCRVHFTVSPEHEEACLAHLEKARPELEAAFGVTLEIGCSRQKASTQTLAVDEAGLPFRSKGGWFSKGSLLFRPGGHGALLENLNDLKGDLILVKNIDNIAATAHQRASLHWKKVLGGVLVIHQEKVHGHLKRLRSGKVSPAEEAEALGLARAVFGFSGGGRESLVRFLDRPLRVCGVVPNTGEPGGGPFWVKGKDGNLSPQIVESAQVDLASGEQQGILKAATHFNPVDLACAVRDPEGRPYDLRKFRDPEAVFISRKTQGGRDLKALELPGLWNGAMADWLTLFVEVPLETFHPVKTVLDLLKPAHQARVPLSNLVGDRAKPDGGRQG